MSLFVPSASKVVTLEIIVNNILLKGVVYRPTIFTFCAIVVGKDSNFKATEIGFIW
jgi:hypothetical protein